MRQEDWNIEGWSLIFLRNLLYLLTSQLFCFVENIFVERLGLKLTEAADALLIDSIATDYSLDGDTNVVEFLAI